MAGNYDYSTEDSSFIGSGTFGQVYKGINKSTNEDIAVKKVPKRVDEEYMKTLRREVDVMKDINHPNLVKMYDADESDKFICFFLEFCDAGDLDEYLQKMGTVELDQKLKVMAQCASGVQYLHEKNIVHRDLKPTNILVKNEDGQPVVKVADFGFARHTPSAGSFDATLCGTMNYWAPENLPNEEERVKYSIAVDVFALGVIYLALLEHTEGQRLVPLKVNNKSLGSWMRDGKAQCVAAPLTFDMKSTQYVNQVKIMVSQMLKMMASDRMTIQQVCGAIKDIQDDKKAAEDLKLERQRLAYENGGLLQEKTQLVQDNSRLDHENRRLNQENSVVKNVNEILKAVLKEIGSGYESMDEKLAETKKRLCITADIVE